MPDVFEVSDRAKPCPFCGGDGLFSIKDDGPGYAWFVWCGSCETHGPGSSDAFGAVELWNIRNETSEEWREQS